MIKAFIFDMDGVIIDSEPLHFEVDQWVMEQIGVRITHSELEEYVGMTNPAMWSRLIVKHSLRASVEDMIKLQMETKLAKLRASDDQPIEGIPELLAFLKANQITIGLASSSPRGFIEAVLDKFSLTSYFSVILSGEEVPQGKPAPDIYLQTAETLGVEAAECMVLEDSRNGVLAAKTAGMSCVGYRNPNSGDQDLTRADFMVDRISDIKPHLRSILSIPKL
ncbi:HAD family hydrolase [Paenibacillus whitsoniae]|uniref:HAD family phosphatase n=1 Tax=Paenibacillus whitsoniae TaxID=2496558 RepID=A0A430J641_9BACL|nr:HAD family phosphatase [Paenibacillus whitsoniae]RTE03971.1 HAD family phosphatase [Paenibacillus whitsoniae]